MNKLWIFGLIILLIVAIGIVIFWYNQSEAKIGTLITNSPGKTDVYRSIYASEKIKLTLENSASIILKNGNIIRLEAGAEIEIMDSGNIILKKGKMWSEINKLENGYKVETPTITATVRGTIFSVSYNNFINEVFMEKGIVLVSLNSNPSIFKEIKDGEKLIIHDSTSQKDFETREIEEKEIERPLPIRQELIKQENKKVGEVQEVQEVQIEEKPRSEPTETQPIRETQQYNNYNKY